MIAPDPIPWTIVVYFDDTYAFSVDSSRKLHHGPEASSKKRSSPWVAAFDPFLGLVLFLNAGRIQGPQGLRGSWTNRLFVIDYKRSIGQKSDALRDNRVG